MYQQEVYATLRPGDVITHCYTPQKPSIIDEQGRLLPEVRKAKERGVMASFRKIEASRVGPVLIEGDTVTARWKFTFTGADGSSRTLEEIAWQTWRGDKLVEERFFYDPRQMAQ